MIRWFFVVFLALMLISWLSPALRKLGFGKLPGDLRFKLFGREFDVPLASTILLSLLASAGNAEALSAAGGTQQFLAVMGAISAKTRTKMSLAYSAGDFAAARDGGAATGERMDRGADPAAAGRDEATRAAGGIRRAG